VVAQEGIEEKGTGEEMMIEETKVLLLEGRVVGVAMAEENERGPYRGRHSAMVTSQKRTTDWMVRVREFDPRGWLGRPTVSGGEREGSYDLFAFGRTKGGVGYCSPASIFRGGGGYA